MERVMIKVGDLVVAVNRFFGSKTSGRVLFFNHATGFCKEVWNPVIEELRKLGNEDEIVTLDQVNHGDSAVANYGKLPIAPFFKWEYNGEHMVAVVNHLYPKQSRNGKKIYGIGHSGGAAAALLAQVFQPGLFDGLIPIEPIIREFSPQVEENSLSLAAQRRRRYFPSKDDAYNIFVTRSLFAGCDPRAVRAYTEYGFRDVNPNFGDTEKTGVTLKCDPLHEAATFRGSQRTELLKRLHEIKVPTFFIRGSAPDAIPLEATKEYVRLLKTSTFKTFQDTGHLLTFQKCTLLAEEIDGWLRSVEQKSKL